jgi:hypothetical protein
MIKQYLLGMLSEEDQERIEERLITNRDFFEQITIVEDELIDDFVGGSLLEIERERFINHFLSTPQQRQRLESARALQQYVSATVSVELPKAGKHIRKSDSWLSRALIAIRIRTASTA